jgi:cytoskeletal protein CcmA (bactofilin family)
MENAAYIGPSIRIKGEVISREPLTIAGHIDGTVDADGHPLTVVVGSHLKATVTAHTIVVAGSVDGQLIANARIVVKDTAKVEGELSAPAISLAEGAVVHGRVETTGEKKPALSLAS